MEMLLWILAIPLCIWMLRASYKEVKAEFGIDDDARFLSVMSWLLAWLIVLIYVLVAVSGNTITLTLVPF